MFVEPDENEIQVDSTGTLQQALMSWNKGQFKHDNTIFEHTNSGEQNIFWLVC